MAELSKHYEHSERNYPRALEIIEAALRFEDRPEMRRREQRLKLRMERDRARGCGLTPQPVGVPPGTFIQKRVT